MANSGHCHAVRIQRDSINSVVINSEPQDKHQRMMVSAHVLLNPTGNACVARDTTLLPLIPGLPHIICLIFAHTVEMRY
jgi:ATP-dependent RNA helicase TDRD9